MHFFKHSRLGAPAIIWGIMALSLIFLVIRSSGIYPGVMGDEYTYNTMSRLMPFSEAYIPDYLYLAVYRMTNLCGDGFFACSRILNTIFFVAAAPFIYSVARRFCGQTVSGVVVALSMLGPINSYTAYFMPEAMFFLSFWVCVSYFFSLDSNAPAKKWIMFGLLMGASSLVKPHALFALPAFCLCLFFFAFKARSDWFRYALKNTLLFVFTTFVVKFLVGFIFAGKAGLTLFGSFYNSQLKQGVSSLQRYFDIIEATPKIVEGHLLANALMFGTALVILLFCSIKSLNKKNILADEKIAFFSLILLLNLVVVVGLFSASVAGSNAIETAFRLHLRYYDFMFPLFFIAVGAQLDQVHTAPFKHWRMAAVAIVVMSIIYAAITKMQPFTPSHIDGPEIFAYTVSKKWFMFMASLSAVSVLVWWQSARVGALVFLFIYLPISVCVTSVYTSATLRNRLVIDEFDKAGLFAKSYIPKAELPRLVVIGDNIAATLRALVYVDDIRATRDLSYVPGAVYSASQTPVERKWVLAIGDVKFAKDEFKLLKLNGFTLAKKISSLYPFTIDFSSSLWSDAVVGMSGLSQTEAWGAWSAEPVVRIEFAEPLPQVFDLLITASAFGPNINQTFNISLGGENFPLVVGDGKQTYTLRIINPGNASVLFINVPKPTSPKELGVSSDTRTLGLGLTTLEIRAVN